MIISKGLYRLYFPSLLLIFVFMAGCQKTVQIVEEEKIETSAVIKFKTSTDVNPDDDNRASPIVVSVVKLRDARQFEREDLISLYQDPELRLGNDFLGIIRLKEFAPGESRKLSIEPFELPEEVKFLGVIAEYSKYQTARATLALPLVANTRNEYLIEVGANGLSLR